MLHGLDFAPLAAVSKAEGSRKAEGTNERLEANKGVDYRGYTIEQRDNRWYVGDEKFLTLGKAKAHVKSLTGQ
ncbi:hypothetical protein [Tranquillimonas alkanivorans]|uniref:hypothetical protein n=1 Tax=Tranquillimonas alkanivorans TaxID=441119 RepID=UPI001160741E|nr:hypothetical protein [Tranquillimonas alkanivorans]